MELIVKVIMIAALFFVIIAISITSNRTIIFEESKKIAENVDDRNSTGGGISANIGANISTGVSTNLNKENTEEKDALETYLETETKRPEEQSSTTQNFIEFKKIDIEVTSNAKIEENQTNFLADPSLNSSYSLYTEMKEVEQGARKYISKGYKISTLNIENVEREGLIRSELRNKYEIIFKPTEDGYNIFIILNQEVDESIKEELLKNNNITIVGEKLAYFFWIRAYR
ncbi:MAG: hypothetical protein ACK4MM_03520 [Fervidobacterium sp.]